MCLIIFFCDEIMISFINCNVTIWEIFLKVKSNFSLVTFAVVNYCAVGGKEADRHKKEKRL